MFRIKRAYEKPSPRDGTRILIDRLWPRGVSKKAGRVDLWLKEVAPSAELRKWFAHDPKKWSAFRTRYFRELKSHPDAVEELLRHARKGTVSLVYAAKDEQHNNAVALKEYLESQRDS